MSYRTHLGGDLRAADVGSRVTLSGWVARRRDHGGLVFVDLRDAGGLVQLVLSPERLPEAHTLRNEFVIQVEGEVRARDPENVNPKLATGQIEVQVGGDGGAGAGRRCCRSSWTTRAWTSRCGCGIATSTCAATRCARTCGCGSS